jgi:transposase-like protein
LDHGHVYQRRKQIGSGWAEKRAVKQAKKVPILAAQGVWPEQRSTQLLAWMRADGEDAASWQTFLEGLWEAGLTPENGLALLVSDGGTGLRAAYENVYWQVPLQRCVFHKLRNIAQAIRVPAGLERQAGHELRTEFLRAAARIWQAPDETEARQRYRAFCETWQTQQAKAVQTLARDFDDTLAFYTVQEQAALRESDGQLIDCGQPARWSACFESSANVTARRSCFILLPGFRLLPLNSQTVFHE